MPGEERPPAIQPGLDRLAGVLRRRRPEKLLPLLKEFIDQGTPLRDLVAAGALANAHAFAGQDYNGYHAFMAMPPRWPSPTNCPRRTAPLPVFKVLYRNSRFIAEGKCHDEDKLAAPARQEPDRKAGGRPPDRTGAAGQGRRRGPGRRGAAGQAGRGLR